MTTMSVRFLPRRGAMVLPILGVLASGCGASAVVGQDTAPGLEILPGSVALPPGGTETFVAQAQALVISGVEWYASAGSITTAGFYTAPEQAGSYQIQASYGGVTGTAIAVVSAPGTPAFLHAQAASTCANMPLRSTGTIRYVCDCQAGAEAGCVPGADANPGTSPAAPKRTWAAALAAFNAMNAGDTVALCRGGAWAVGASTGAADCSNQVTNARCAAGTSLTDPANPSTCDLRDYRAPWGGSAKPIISASSTASTRLLNRYLGSTNGVRIMNLDFRGGNAGPRGGVYHDHRAITSGICNTQADSHWLICNNDFTRFRLALNLSNTGTSSNFLIWGNRFTLNDLDSILGVAGSNTRIDANFFDNNGGFMHPVSGNRAHDIYLTRLSNPASAVSTNISVTNNEFRRSGSGSTPGACEAGVLVGHAQWNGVNVENNVIDGGAGAGGQCWGIDLRAAGSDPTYFRNMRLHRNWVSAGGAGIVVGQAPGVFIENNVVALTSNLTWKQGIMSPMDAARPGVDDVQNNTTVRSNTIYLTGGGGGVNAVVVGTEGVGHVIANNSVQTGGGTCFSTPLAAGAYGFVGNNACYGGAWGTTHDATARVTGDPRYASPPTDFTPLPGSPLIGAGNAAYAPSTDYAVRSRAAPPSIGAFEP